ncbi:hypothetical protein GPJ56_004619 [Histomonas meleagridis]|uniref:uncharacterized protein n=1 Tax=Histomonas meleagridis TaxID=135588 RepID=UPI003559B7F5|nr:hypothetical protein GPJ56_004619 [Histomonas meleagridis]KAH0797380.1 hypothetical protein GO595_009701 [Histomonas meleagridis]
MWRRLFHAFIGTPRKYEYSPVKSPKTPTNSSFGEETIYIDYGNPSDFQPKSRLLGDNTFNPADDAYASNSSDDSSNDFENAPAPKAHLLFHKKESSSSDSEEYRPRKITFPVFPDDISNSSSDENIPQLPEYISKFEPEYTIPTINFPETPETPIIETKRPFKPKIHFQQQYNPFQVDTEFKQFEESDFEDSFNDSKIGKSDENNTTKQTFPSNSQSPKETSSFISKTNPFDISDSSSDSDQPTKPQAIDDIKLSELSPNKKQTNSFASSSSASSSTSSDEELLNFVKKKPLISFSPHISQPKFATFQPIKINSTDGEIDEKNLVTEYENENETFEDFPKHPIKSKPKSQQLQKVELSFDDFNDEDERNQFRSALLAKSINMENSSNENEKKVVLNLSNAKPVQSSFATRSDLQKSELNLDAKPVRSSLMPRKDSKLSEKSPFNF